MMGNETIIRFYRAYGIVLKSSYELPYPEIEPVDNPDVNVYEAEVSRTLDECVVRHGIWQTGPMQFLLIDDTVARILVRGGSEVLVQKMEGVDPRWISVFINGSALAALLQQRGLLPLHASAIHTDNKAILFAGASGVGKSTLCATMRERGFGVLSEDVSAIRLSKENTPLIDPSFGHLRLWKDAAQKLGYDVRGMRIAANEFQKYEFPVEQTVDRALPVRTIYFLAPKIKRGISIETLSQRDAFQHVYSRSYRRRFHLGQGLEQQHFKLVCAVTNGVQLKMVSRPSQDCDPTDVADMIEHDLKIRDEPNVVQEVS